MSYERRQCHCIFSRLQQLIGAVADMTDIVLVARVAHRAKELERHHVRKADDSVEGGAQLVIDPRHQLRPVLAFLLVGTV